MPPRPRRSENLLRLSRDAAKRFVIVLVEAPRYFKTDRDGTQKIMAKYHATANKPYLDDAYQTTAKILD